MKTLVINVSDLLTWMTCPRKYHFQRQRRLMPVGESEKPDDNLSFGTAVHNALKAMYSSNPLNLDEALLAFEETLPEGHGQREYGNTLLTAYHKQYVEDDSRRYVSRTFIEEELSTPIGEIGDTRIVLIGRPDLIASDATSGGSWHLQHKTVGKTVSIETYVTGYNLSSHERAYGLLAEAHGHPINGSILNCLIKTARPGFYRAYIPITPADIRDIREKILLICQWILAGHFPQFDRSCVLYNKVCKFMPLCTGQPVFPDLWTTRPPDYCDILSEKLNDTSLDIT